MYVLAYNIYFIFLVFTVNAVFIRQELGGGGSYRGHISVENKFVG